MAKETSIIGEKALDDRLVHLKKQSTRNRMLRPAVREAVGVIRKMAKDNVIEETGLLKQSIGTKIKTYKDVVFGVVGPRTGFKEGVFRVLEDGRKVAVISDPVRYAHLVEFGTSKQKAYPFMRPAYDLGEAEALRKMQSRVTLELDKEAQKK